MDLMDVRRMMMGVIAGMAGGVTLLHGEFTPTTDETTHTIDPGRDVTFILLQCTSGELIRGTRNFAYMIVQFVDNEIRKYGSASNANGTTWGSMSLWYKINDANAVTKNGTAITFAPNTFASGAMFYASRTYEWYAI